MKIKTSQKHTLHWHTHTHTHTEDIFIYIHTYTKQIQKIAKFVPKNKSLFTENKWESKSTNDLNFKSTQNEATYIDVYDN